MYRPRPPTCTPLAAGSRSAFGGFVVGLVGLAACGPAPADLVLLGGAVYPFATDSVRAEAVVVRDGRVVLVGTDAEARRYLGRRTEVIELAGRMVLPAFRDTHVHPRGGIGLAYPRFDDLETREAILDSVRRYAVLRPEVPWIRGRGWQLPVFPAGNPRKEWLDSVVADRPVYLTAADGHSAWVNSKALEIAGVTRDTPDPPKGRIERDARTGAPSGTLRESAMGLVERHLPPYSPEEIRTGLLRAVALANRHGIVVLHDADTEPPLAEAYLALDREGRLDARVIGALPVEPSGGLSQVDTLRAWRARFMGPGRFRPAAVKLFADGVIEAKTAALLQPYADGSGNRGPANFTAGGMDTLVAALDGAGFQIHIHAIGDRAVRMSLDALGFARRMNGPRDARPIIAHLELIDPADLPRFAELGVVPSFQPLWAYADRYITELTEPVLGPVRSRWLYPIGSVAKAGARLGGGSDWSVSSMNPLEAIQVGVTRRGVETGAEPAWIPQETVELNTMLRAYTSNAAWAAGDEATAGTLEPGKWADLAVLDRNLHAIPTTEIAKARVLLTLLEGRAVFRDSALP